jgi:cytolysin-activating lysine-acyltransferase
MDFPIASLKMRLFPPAKLSQLHLFVDEGDRKLLGYMTWAWFSEETEQRWIAGSMDTIHISEWNEGERLWILDFATLPGYTELCVKRAPLVFPEGTVAYSLARRASVGIADSIEWTRLETGSRLVRRRRLSIDRR